MPIGDYPILEVIVRQLVRCGFTHITMAVNYQAELIQAFFGDGSKWGVKIDYSFEHKPLSTMAPLRLIDDLPENFLVMNGDILTDLDYGAFYSHHVVSSNSFTVATYQREIRSEFGILEVDSQNTLVAFYEKPMQKYEVSMGVYIVSKKVIEYIPKDTFYGFDHLMGDMLRRGDNPKAYRFGGYWLDIGRPDDYEKATEEFDTMADKFLK